MDAPHDMRLNDAWGLWCKRQFEERPEIKSATEGLNPFSAFAAGWHYRYEAVQKRLEGDVDISIMRDEFARYREADLRATNQVLGYMAEERRHRKTIASLSDQVRALRGNAYEAPAFRRITQQRQELTRLLAVNAKLREQLAEQTSPGSGTDA